eukprot:Seg3156.5 transcript_id=Seg3156.5/GoldUCD/mRNA.D3Y31 product="hypothetical protein" protein_id=Seg3156.5/GoldUCD/D3Y31
MSSEIETTLFDASFFIDAGYLADSELSDDETSELVNDGYFLDDGYFGDDESSTSASDSSDASDVTEEQEIVDNGGVSPTPTVPLLSSEESLDAHEFFDVMLEIKRKKQCLFAENIGHLRYVPRT